MSPVLATQGMDVPVWLAWAGYGFGIAAIAAIWIIGNKHSGRKQK